MSDYNCQSHFCFYYGEYELGKCEKASHRGNVTFIQECRANRKLQEHLEKTKVQAG